MKRTWKRKARVLLTSRTASTRFEGVNLDESGEVEGCCGLSQNMAAGGRETTEDLCCRTG